MPEGILAIIYLKCDLRTQRSLAHSSSIFRKLWRYLKLPGKGKDPTYFNTASDMWEMVQLHNVLGNVEYRMRFDMIQLSCKGSTSPSIHSAYFNAPLVGYFTPELLQYLIREAYNEVPTSAIMSRMQKVFRDSDAEILEGQALVFTFKLHHCRQASFTDHELAAIGFCLRYLPHMFAGWARARASCFIICSPAWQLISPDGTSLDVFWEISDKDDVDLVTHAASCSGI